VSISRVDTNQPEIVKALRKAGALVLHLHEIGKGTPDILVGYRGRLRLMEIKDGAKSPSKRELTPDEEKFHAIWADYVWVVQSVDDALKLIGAI
jgi:hypothetical protein